MSSLQNRQFVNNIQGLPSTTQRPLTNAQLTEARMLLNEKQAFQNMHLTRDGELVIIKSIQVASQRTL